MLHISIKAESIFEIGGFAVTNSLLTSFIVVILFSFLALFYYGESKKQKKSNFFYLVQYLLKTLYNFFQTILGDNIALFFPLIGALFFFVLLQNWFGLLPGIGSIVLQREHETVPLFRGTSADLNATIGLAIIAVILIQFYSIKFLGAGGFLKRFFSSLNPMSIFVGLLEIVSEFSKVVSFSFRLFGNVFAGEILIAIIAFLLPWFLSFAIFPFLVLEIFVGFIQALVFSMLTAVFLSMAINKSHH